MTATEVLLWERLRDRRLAGLKFRRQHAIGRFVVDFYCHELRLVVEIDGTVHDGPERKVLDAQRQEELESLGLRFLRVRTEDVATDVAGIVSRLAYEITRLRESRSRPHPPAPSPDSYLTGEGE